jgi:hypothetical protein
MEPRMNAVDKATRTRLANIQARTGKTLDQLYALLRGSGRGKHGELRDWLKTELGLGHGDANTLVHFFLKADEPVKPAGADSPDGVLDGIYAGKKAGLRPIHEAVMAGLQAFGDFEVAPKKGYVSLRCKKQFAMLGPGSQTRVDLGLNMKGVAGGGRLQALPPGGMCQYKVALAAPGEVDAELLGWIRAACDSAG